MFVPARTWLAGMAGIVGFDTAARGFSLWGVTALRFAQPIVLLKLGANVAGFVFIVSSLHLLYVNTRLLPPHVRPPTWRRVALVVTALFYAFFVAFSVHAAFIA